MVELARDGDEAAFAAFEDAGRALGVLLATAVHIADPAAIVLTGDGLLGELLTWVLTYERGRFESLAGGSPAADVILRDAYLEAVRWADAACSATTAES